MSVQLGYMVSLHVTGLSVLVFNCVFNDVWLQTKRSQQHKDLKNRRLLWHGTNIAVVAAILKSGLRIMPHSGGCFGKGIYHSSMNAKSYGYSMYNVATHVYPLSINN